MVCGMCAVEWQAELISSSGQIAPEIFDNKTSGKGSVDRAVVVVVKE